MLSEGLGSRQVAYAAYTSARPSQWTKKKKNREIEGCGSVDKKVAQHAQGPVYNSLYYINQLC